MLRFDKIEYNFDEVADFESFDLDEDESLGAVEELDEDEISGALSPFLCEQHNKKFGGVESLGFSGDHVFWLQSAETPEGHRVFFQFYDDLLEDLNFGSGVLYVAVEEDGKRGLAWWQC